MQKTDLAARRRLRRRRSAALDHVKKIRTRAGDQAGASPGTEIKISATVLAAGILLDATIVRAILVPAAVSILGRWNWWLPPWPARVLRVEPSLIRREAAAEET